MRSIALVVSAILITACAKASTLREEQPVGGGLGKYASVTVETKFENEALKKEIESFDSRLTQHVIDELKKKAVFTKIGEASAGAGDMAIQMTITKASKGSSLNQMVGTMNDATVDVTTELVDAKESKPLGKFQVHADSSRSVRVGVNNVDTATGSNPLNRAVDSAALEIVEYVAVRK